MSMQQIMRWGHDFLRNREGECLTLSPFGENPCVKRKHPKMYGHSLMHSHFHLPSRFGERRDVLIIHPSRFQFISSLCMPSPSYGSHQNAVVHSNHSLFHYVHERCAMVQLLEPCFFLDCSSSLSSILYFSPA